ncbi:MAG: phosphoribosylaminoimidazolesuccinocarboxamide synthase [Ignavibacteriaceae bacterium]
MNPKIILQTDFPKLHFIKKGKVRDIYDAGEYYLIVSTDRLSAFDVIMSQGIPYKGKVLTRISEFWFGFTKNIIQNHLITTNVDEFPAEFQEYADDIEGRSMLVKKAKIFPVECIVRGYISGSGWNDYQRTGSVSGITLPKGLVESEILPQPIFTPSTKAEIGVHDENISSSETEKIIGKEVFDKIKYSALSIYKTASEFALTKGIIIADTKMEFGIYNNEVILADEVLTPDSSRFWPLNSYQKGKAQESYDKQFVRDYLISIDFNKQPPPPVLPESIIEKTRDKYLEALYQLTGEKLV